MLKRYNFGCGGAKLEGYINIDCEPSVEPDLLFDIRKEFPIESNSAEQIIFLHTIEHIQEIFHVGILQEMHRILHPDGEFILAYPEFIKCAQNYISNYKGNRDFWKATIFGRQINERDVHVALMHTPTLTEIMLECGFKDLVISPEPREDYNTIIRARKGVPMPSYEEHITNTILA